MGKSKQKTVKVNKEPCNKNNYYTTINLDALAEAVKRLDGDAFKMWVYFSKNQNEYEFELSSKHAIENYGLSKARYDKAIHALVSNGNLVDTNSDPSEVANRWTFYERPHKNKDNKPLQEKSTRLDNSDDKSYPTENTRNNTDKTDNKTDNNLLPPVGFQEMTDQQRREYFNNHY